jgi:hypothetical protein
MKRALIIIAAILIPAAAFAAPPAPAPTPEVRALQDIAKAIDLARAEAAKSSGALIALSGSVAQLANKNYLYTVEVTGNEYWSISADGNMMKAVLECVPNQGNPSGCQAIALQVCRGLAGGPYPGTLYVRGYSGERVAENRFMLRKIICSMNTGLHEGN